MAVDTHTVPRIFADDASPASDAESAMALITKSGKAEACLARNYFRFTYARWENPVSDGCALEASRKALKSGGTISDLVKAATLAPDFRERTFE